MKNFTILLIFTALLFLQANVARAQTASGGGGYTLEQSVIASGGNSNSAVGNFTLAGTIGQAAAGSRPTAAAFGAQNGFWHAAPLAPTAAMVSVSGRVTTNDGRGIRNALVTLTNASGASHTVLTGKFGAFKFHEIEAGQTVIVSVSAKRFIFAQPTQIFFVAEEAEEINFVADNKPEVS